MAKSSNPLGQSVYIQERPTLPTVYEGELVNVLGVTYFWDDATSLYKEVGSGGGGGGGFTYIENGDFADNLDGYTRYTNTTPGVAPDNFGGTPNVNFTFTRHTTDPLSGAAHGRISKDAVNRQGHGVYYDLDLERADLASILRLMFDFQTSANYVTGDIRLYAVFSNDGFVSDRQNVEFIARDLDAVGFVKQYISELQSFSDRRDCRICWHVATTSALAYTVDVDRVSFGPREIARGPMITEWQSYTPTFGGFGTCTNIAMYWRRVGSHMEVRGRFVSGTVTADTATVSLPSGFTIAPLNPTFDRNYFGELVRNGTASPYRVVGVNNQSLVRFGAGSSSHGDVAGNSLLGSSETVLLSFNLPITGWGASSTLSSDFGGRNISAFFRTETTSIANATEATVPLDFTDIDTVAGKSGNTYVVQESGEYELQASYETTGSGDTGFIWTRFRKNSANIGYRATSQSSTTIATSVMNYYKGNFIKGDIIDLRLVYGQGSNRTVQGVFSISKRATPQSLAGGEKVQMFAHTSTTSINNAFSPMVNVVYSTKTRDTHNAYNAATGDFTIPKSGWYDIKTLIRLDALTLSTSQVFEMVLKIAGSDSYRMNRIPGNGVSNSVVLSGSIGSYFTQGQVISIGAFQNSGGAVSLGAGSLFNWLSIESDG